MADAIYKVRDPSGRIREIKGPEGASDDEVIARAKQLFSPVKEDPTTRMSTSQKLLAGIGKSFYDVGRGAGQLMGIVSQKDIDEAKEQDKPLMNTGAGMGGNILGSAAIALPTALIPGVNTYAGAALAGGLLGGLQPVATGEDRLVNTASGVAGGVIGQGVGNAVGRAIRPIAGNTSPERNALVDTARREGIQLTAGQRTGSRPLQITESVMENLPLTSGPQLAIREQQQRAFTQATLKRAGIQGDNAGAGVLGQQRSALGNTFENISTRNNLDIDPVVIRLADILDDAKQHIPPKSVDRVAETVDQILAQSKNGLMSGTNYQGWREPLRTLAKPGDETSRYFNQIRKALDDEFSSGLTGTDAQTFADASRKYANLKTVTNAMGGAGNLPAVGQVAPAQLSSAVMNAMGREGRALGRGDLNELSRVGTTFLRDQIPNSGTAQRQVIQSLLTTGGGSAIGAGAAAGTGNDPLKGMAYGAAIGAAGLTTPRMVQALMNSRAGQAYLSNQTITPAQRKVITSIIRSGAIGASQGDK